MIRRTISVIGFALMSSGCGHRVAYAVPKPSPEADVYAAVVAAIRTKATSDTLLVADSTVTFQRMDRHVTNRRDPGDMVPVELLTRLAELSRTRRASTTLALPRPIRIITDAELSEIFRTGINGWAEFHRRFPSQRSWSAFSPVAFNSDRSQAYLYYEYFCGGLCAGGEGFWLVRSSLTGEWTVRMRRLYWMS